MSLISIDIDQHLIEHEIAEVMRWFEFDHLPEGKPRDASECHAALAAYMIDSAPHNRELIAGLRKLLEAKDCAVRAHLAQVVHADILF